MALAQWLSGRPEVLRVIHPALPDHPGHALWKRDFSGSSGLFSIVLKPASEAAVAAFLDGLELFGLGYSWGGYESLALPFDCTPVRTATHFSPGGPTVRFSVGLEDIEDLKADLDTGLCAAEGDGLTDMRNFLIDTDTASDDAVAIIMALSEPNVRVLGLTTVAGNVGLEQATQNALLTAEICNSNVPVFVGADKPLTRAHDHAHWFHGKDGMGDRGFPRAETQARA